MLIKFLWVLSIIIIIFLIVIIVIYSRKSSSESFENSDDQAYTGFLATDPNLVVYNNVREKIYSLKDFSFLGDSCSKDLVSSTLNDQSKLLYSSGLFEVLHGLIYQVRSYDLGNITLIKTKHGFLMVDTLTSTETCKAALELATSKLGKLRIHTVIITHSHIDHFGGIEAVLDYCSPDRPYIITSLNFFNESVQEYIAAHHLLKKRSAYMYGTPLQPSCNELVSSGLGLRIASGGQFNIIKPDKEISNLTPQPLVIDDITIDIWYTPDAEARTELMFYVRDYESLCASEILVHTLHNLYSPRGTPVRNGYLWASYIDNVIQYYENRIQCVFASHHWPMWGRTSIISFLRNQRDLYRFINDQTIRYADMGYEPNTIASMLKPPEDLVEPMYNKSFYGSFKMNVRAQYDLYFGPFNGNPAYLDPLPELEEAKVFIQFGGGVDQCIDKANKAIQANNHQWAITILNKVIKNDQDNKKARQLLASVYTTIAYKQENSVWRNFYLTGAQELLGHPVKIERDALNVDTLRQYDLDDLFRFMSIQISSAKAESIFFKTIFKFLESNETRYVELSHGVLFSRKDYVPTECVDFEISTIRLALFALSNFPNLYKLLKKLGFIKVEGSEDKAQKFFNVLEPFHGTVQLVFPASSKVTNLSMPSVDLITSDPKSLLPFIPSFAIPMC